MSDMVDCLSIKCKHGNYPHITEVKRYQFRAQCQDCRCGRGATLQPTPIAAAFAWRRSKSRSPVERRPITFRALKKECIWNVIGCCSAGENIQHAPGLAKCAPRYCHRWAELKSRDKS